MKENNKNKLLAVTCVFSFVAFCFAIANTFGNTYAASGDICPYGWDTSSIATQCTKDFDTEELCESAIEGLGLTVVEQSDYNTCASNFSGTSYKGTIQSKRPGNGVTFTVTLNANGGSFDGSETKIKSCEAYIENDKCVIGNLPEPTTAKTNSIFKHWIWTNNSGTSSIKAKAGDSITVSSNMTLTAQWEETKTYSLEFHEKVENNTTNLGTVTIKMGNSTITNPVINGLVDNTYDISNYTATSSNGYIFKGWSGDNCSNILSGTVNLDTYSDIYACWGKKATPPEDENDEPEGGTNTPDPDEPIIEPYTATFNPNEGTLDGDDELTCKPASANETCEVTSLPTAERDGYIFKGWGTSKDCTSGNTSSLTLTEDKTYYACFTEEEPIEYTIKFNTDGGTLYRNGNKTSKLSYDLISLRYSDYTALKTGYTFIGWRTGTENSCVNASKNKVISELTSNLSLIACYKKDDTGITENPNTGSTLLYIAFLTGILALTYTCYYSYKAIKLKK